MSTNTSEKSMRTLLNLCVVKNEKKTNTVSFDFFYRS